MLNSVSIQCYQWEPKRLLAVHFSATDPTADAIIMLLLPLFTSLSATDE